MLFQVLVYFYENNRFICVTNDHGSPPLVIDSSQSFLHSWLVTVFVTKVTRWVPLMEQELFTLPDHMSLPSVCSGVRVARSLFFVCSVLHLVFVLFRLPWYCLFIDLRIMITPLVSSPNNRPVKIIVDI